MAREPLEPRIEREAVHGGHRVYVRARRTFPPDDLNAGETLKDELRRAVEARGLVIVDFDDDIPGHEDEKVTLTYDSDDNARSAHEAARTPAEHTASVLIEDPGPDYEEPDGSLPAV
jgi:hypothetical protein